MLVDTLEASLIALPAFDLFLIFRLISRKSWASISFFQQQFSPPRYFYVRRLDLFAHRPNILPLALGPDLVRRIQDMSVCLFHSRPGNVFPQFPAKKLVRVLRLEARPTGELQW